MMLLFKLDGDKALDSLSWTFFDNVMWQMYFGITWRSWIRSILSSSRVSVLVKESRTKEFIMEKGVRQGDPFSPFLFIIVMEGHNVAMDEAWQKGFFARLYLPFSLFRYSEDAIFFGEWSMQNARKLMRILTCLPCYWPQGQPRQK